MRWPSTSERPNCASAVRFRSGKLICTPTRKLLKRLPKRFAATGRSLQSEKAITLAEAAALIAAVRRGPEAGPVYLEAPDWTR